MLRDPIREARPPMKLSHVVTLAFLLNSAQAATAPRTVEFPQNFKWCVSTAAYQVEGNDSDSDWWDWEQTPGHIANGDKSGMADDEWNRVSEDIGLMKQLGVGVYRFSVEWAKIEPVEGNFDPDVIAHYQDEIKQLQDAGITPLITLHHFTLPRWVRAKGGWEWDGSADAFARFTELAYTQIAPGAHDWITFNEPMVHAMSGYIDGSAPPGEKRAISGIIPVVRGILKAHARAYHLLHSLAAKAGYDVRVGMAHHLRTFDAYNWFNPLDYLSAYLVDNAWNWTIPDALESGKLSFHMLWLANDDEEIQDLQGTQDYVGVNYYTGDLMQFSFTQGFVQHNRDDLPKTDVGWDIYPEGFDRILHKVADRYSGKSILITENGIADSSDAQRPDFIRDHLRVLAHAIDDGIPVEAYCHWSLMDNFEWSLGFTPRFGLFAVDYTTFARVPRASAELYHDIIRDQGF
jgi:beta-glucosidase